MSSSMVIVNDNEEQVRGELTVGEIWGGEEKKKQQLRKQESDLNVYNFRIILLV